MGTRLMKYQQLKEEIEKSIEDEVERGKVLEGSLGQVLSSTQVRHKRKAECQRDEGEIFRWSN